MFNVQTSKALFLLPMAMLAATAAPAITLTNGSGDNEVNITANGSGTFSAAYLNPKGPLPVGDTTFNSYAYFRMGSSGGRTALVNHPATTVSSSPTEAVSLFRLGALDVTLTQTLSGLFDMGGNRIGSVLTQSYGFTNTGSATIDFSMARYIDGDMGFAGASRSAAGGGITSIDGTTQAIFETLKTVGLDDETIFLGITSEGGTALGYEVDYYSTVNSHAQSGSALGNIVAKDLNGDGLIDIGRGYDVGLAMESGFRIDAGQQGQWVTRTLFGSGPLGAITFAPPAAVPEPGTWAMLIAGFGLVGSAMRRRPTVASFA